MTLRVVSLVGLWAVVVGCAGDVGGGGTSATAGTTGAGGGTTGSGGSGAMGGTGNNCGFTPCGGDVVGTWTATAACGDFAAAAQAAFGQPACAGLVQSATLGSFSMTAEFSTDGTYSTSGSAQVNVAMALTQACLTAIAGTPTTLDATVCQSFGTTLGQGTGITNASCTFTGGNCVCQYTGTSTFSETGTYSVSGSTLTLTPTGGTAGQGQFCVQNTTLRLTDDTGIVTVLQRQP